MSGPTTANQSPKSTDVLSGASFGSSKFRKFSVRFSPMFVAGATAGGITGRAGSPGGVTSWPNVGSTGVFEPCPTPTSPKALWNEPLPLFSPLRLWISI